MKPIRIGKIVEITKGILLQGDESAVVTSVVYDSRQQVQGAFFVPIVGEKTDGHRFIEQVLKQGAVGSFTSQKNIPMPEGKAYIYVEDTLTALQEFASFYRSMFDIPVVGVTGSVGKTTTKEMIASVLDKEYNVLRTYKNWNSQLGLAMMMFEIDEDTDIAVIEMGVSGPGEMDRLVKMAKPETAVLTNIGVSHMEGLGSREKICIEKGKIIQEFKNEGILYVCGNEDYISLTKENIHPIASKGNCRMIYYGTHPGCDVYAEQVDVKENEETQFAVCVSGQEDTFRLKVLGIHNVNNALAAICIGRQFGVSSEKIREALYQYEPLDMRGNIKKANGITVIDDTYNASTDSMISGLQVLYEKRNAGRRIAVLADILELGNITREQHERVGHEILNNERAGKVLDELITVGKSAKYIANVVRSGAGQIKVESFDDNKKAAGYLTAHKRSQDVYFIKGSRGMHMEEICSQILS